MRKKEKRTVTICAILVKWLLQSFCLFSQKWEIFSISGLFRSAITTKMLLKHDVIRGSNFNYVFKIRITHFLHCFFNVLFWCLLMTLAWSNRKDPGLLTPPLFEFYFNSYSFTPTILENWNISCFNHSSDWKIHVIFKERDSARFLLNISSFDSTKRGGV